MDFKRNSILFIAIIFTSFLPACGNAQTDSKKLFLPPKIWMVPAHNNFYDTASKYNMLNHAESANFAIFWAKAHGHYPKKNQIPTLQFSPDSMLLQCERFYKFFVDSLQFIEKRHSVAEKYKILIFVFDENDGTAYGGGTEDSSHTGILWTSPLRINRQPYGVIAHELGHVFQYFVTADGNAAFQSAGQTMYEMTSQFMLWQVYPEWLTFENYHLKAFLGQTHLSFLHPDNQYHSPFVLEYWSEKYGKEFIGELWRSAQKDEDAVMVYKRLSNLSQSQFNDEMFDACRHFVNWNMQRIKTIARPYAHLHKTKLNKVQDGWYQIDSNNCPQNYGYNAIELEMLKKDKKIKLSFEGETNMEGYKNVNVMFAGWRYGFVVEDSAGQTTYSKVFSQSTSIVKFSIPSNSKYLWLVVMGAPTQHWNHPLEEIKNNHEVYEQWPYKIKIEGAEIKSL